MSLIFDRFLILVFKNTPGRRFKFITYSTLNSYRIALLFWIPRKHLEQKIVPPAYEVLWPKMAEAMRSIHARYAEEFDQHVEMVMIGLPELMQLIDFETIRNVCIENSEQHVAAWCLARFTACRPGALGPDAAKRALGTGFIVWRDFEFRRGDEPGMFDMSVTFRYLKTNTLNQEKKLKYPRATTVKCLLKAPVAAHISLSPALRFLTIALRRGYLVDITTVDELLNYPLQYIKVNRPVLHLFTLY